MEAGTVNVGTMETPACRRSMEELFPSYVADVERAYCELQHRLGWRLLTCPKTAFIGKAPVAFISLNPGGGEADKNDSGGSCEEGSAYIRESWGQFGPGQAPLQVQVQALFKRVHTLLGSTLEFDEFVKRDLVSAHYIPFRSPNLKALPRRAESFAFAQRLWSSILQKWSPRLILTIDRDSFAGLSTILAKEVAGAVNFRSQFETGWGRCTADVVRFRVPGSEGEVTLARLPHLSRFKLFAGTKYLPYVDRCLEVAVASVHGDGPNV